MNKYLPHVTTLLFIAIASVYGWYNILDGNMARAVLTFAYMFLVSPVMFIVIAVVNKICGGNK
jgi:hypothetical protein